MTKPGDRVLERRNTGTRVEPDTARIINEGVGLRVIRAAAATSSFWAEPQPAARLEAAEVADRVDLFSLIVFSFLPLSSWMGAVERLRHGESPASALATILADQPDRMSELQARAVASMRRAEARGIAPVGWGDASYPVALTTLVDPPPVLWKRGANGSPGGPGGSGEPGEPGEPGEIDALNRPAVAIVGARAASPYGLSVAGRLASDLAEAGLVVVSGMARGVDSAAHRGALAAGGTSVAVFGSGVDVVYPPEHAALARDLERSGAVVSELVPGTPPLARFFPMRNRIISGLSRAVVVIEAGERSGSLITARSALEQGREVLAVPGNVLTGRNRGAHGLLRDGAKIVESADDILEELGMASGVRPGTDRSDRTGDAVLACLAPGEAVDLDAIAMRTGLPPTRLLQRLSELELQGSSPESGVACF